MNHRNRNEEFNSKSETNFGRNKNYYVPPRKRGFHSSSSYNFIKHKGRRNTSGSSEYPFHSPKYQSSRKSSAFHKDYYWNQTRKERESPPLNGSEEYTLRKIQETSDMIKRQLMSPDNTHPNESIIIPPNLEPRCEVSETKNQSNRPSKELIRAPLKKRKSILREKLKKNSDTYNVKEIHNQIMKHITKLNYGRKQNLINACSTGYDAAIQQIYKQKRLELSKALREMSHQEKPEASIVNAIIPDFAIKFEELPVDVIRELSSTFETFETDIGELNEIPSYDFGFEDSFHSSNSISLVNNSIEYEHNDGIHYVNKDSQGRVLHLNAENPDLLVIKQEDLLETKIKSEPSDVIELIDSEDDTQTYLKGNNAINEKAHSSLKENNWETQWRKEKIVSDRRITPIHFDTNVNTAYNETSNTSVRSDLNMSLQNSNPIGSLRLNKSIKQPPNEILSEGQNQNFSDESVESHEIFSRHGKGINSIPRIKINTNIFDKIYNCLSDDCTINEGQLSSKPLSEDSLAENIKTNESRVLDGTINSSTNGNNSSSLQEQQHMSESLINSSCENGTTSVENGKRKETTQPNEHSENISVSSHLMSHDTEELLVDENSMLDENAVTYCANNSITESLDNPHPYDETPNDFISVIIKPFTKPKNLWVATEMMLQIDREIEKLTKLRQHILISMATNPIPVERQNCRLRKEKRTRDQHKRKRGVKKRKTHNSNQNETPATITSNYSSPTIDFTRDTIDEVNDTVRIQQKENNGNQGSCSGAYASGSVTHTGQVLEENVTDLDIEDLSGAALVCKFLHKEKLVIVGTDNGKIQYFHLYKQKKPVTLGISQNAITCLESWYIEPKLWICTGTASEHEMTILDYRNKKLYKDRRKFILEDGIQVMQRAWIYIFIGGSRGYLTRFNCQKDKIEFEDRISEMTIKDLKATREGPRKILVMLLKDEVGNCQIHVRDAMSALHMRTIISDYQNVTCLLLNNSSLYFALNEDIWIYSFCDGLFIAKINVPTEKSIAIMKSKGNLLLASTSEGIYMYNMINRDFLDPLPCNSIASMGKMWNDVIVGTWSKKLKFFRIPERILAINSK